jgi:hypothetical protein
MRHGIITIVTPVQKGLHAGLCSSLSTLDRRTFQRLINLHFASFSVIHDPGDGQGDPELRPHLVFEASFDGTREDFIDELVHVLGVAVDRIYANCEGYPPQGRQLPHLVKNYLLRHDKGADTLYIAYPGRTVTQIKQEKQLRSALIRLRHRIDPFLARGVFPPPSQRSIVSYLRRKIARHPRLRGVLVLPERPFVVTYGGRLLENLLRGIFALVFLGFVVQQYPVLSDRGSEHLLPGILLILSIQARLISVWRPRWKKTAGTLFLAAVAIWLARSGITGLVEAIDWATHGVITLAVVVSVVVLLLVAIVVLWIIALQFCQELWDEPDPSQPSWDSAREKVLRHRENKTAQNHMVGLNRVKRGLMRKPTLRVVLWIIHFTKHLEKSGTLSGVSTIHFARWVVINEGKHLLFLSNYDGDWDAYLGDFVAQASTGLTAIWSNCAGFPRTWFLMWGGAKDERAFKAYARRHQHETLFHYSAYPDLTVAEIENHTAIREALGRSLDGAGLDALLGRL